MTAQGDESQPLSAAGRAHIPVQLSTYIHSEFQTSCSSSSEHLRVAARDTFKVFMVEGDLAGKVAGKLRYGQRHTLPYAKLRPCMGQYLFKV